MITRMRQYLGLQAFGRFAGDRRGVSAVEFALLAPLMISLYLGSVEVSTGVIADRKVTLTAAALANLTAQVATISASDMTNILDASAAIIAPFSAGNLKMTISCVVIDANKNATVKWSVTRNGAVRNGALAIPAALAVANSQLIFAEASYDYTPTIGYTITGTLTLADRMYMSPRISAPTYNNTACS
jgi:Flp pilus assembly protein TadG